MKEKNKSIYLCESCGNEFSTWSGKCSMCGEWNTLKEVSFSFKPEKGSNRKNTEEPATKITDIVIDKNYREKTGISEFDRVLGGGIVPGSIILIGGEPGIGKSTLLLEVAGKIDNTLYLSGEESLSQIKMRAVRLGIKNESIVLYSDPALERLPREVEKQSAKLLIVDSIQTVFLESYNSTPGSLVQVRECGIFLQQLAKKTGIPIIVIGHVTKEGSLAGPRMLEHLVDTVLYLEGDRFSDARILRGIKNRFGPTNEVGVFSMEEKGMAEVRNPSELFLAQRENNPGSVVTVALEGSRPILVEIQALVVPTHFGYPKRTSSGFDLNRLNLLAAVISKQTFVNLSNYDIYLNVVGGIRLNEPAIDLAVCGAIISSFKNKAIKADSVLFGEIGLLGEIRKISRQTDRLKEAKNLGYKPIEDIKNLKDLFKIIV